MFLKTVRIVIDPLGDSAHGPAAKMTEGTCAVPLAGLRMSLVPDLGDAAYLHNAKVSKREGRAPRR